MVSDKRAPNDVVAYTWLYADRFPVPQVCEHFKSVIDTSVALLYKNELEIEGYVDGSRKDLCMADRLRLLIERRDRWLRLDWIQRLSLAPEKIIPESPLPYELQGGISYNVVTHAGGKYTMNATRLPSTDNPKAVYQNKPFDIQYVDITTDPSQDLMVVLDVLGRYVLAVRSDRRVFEI